MDSLNTSLVENVRGRVTRSKNAKQKESQTQLRCLAFENLAGIVKIKAPDLFSFETVVERSLLCSWICFDKRTNRVSLIEY